MVNWILVELQKDIFFVFIFFVFVLVIGFFQKDSLQYRIFDGLPCSGVSESRLFNKYAPWFLKIKVLRN